MDWDSEERQKFIKKKALYQKTGLSNVFKNKTKSLKEVQSKTEYLRKIVEWTVDTLQRPQWKAEIKDMEGWLKNFEKKIVDEYRPIEGKIDAKEKIWKFNKENYQRELLAAFEDEEKKGKPATPSVTTRRQRRTESGASTSSSNLEEKDTTFNETMTPDITKSKMAELDQSVEKGSLKKDPEWNQSDDEENDYAWSDVMSTDSRCDIKQNPIIINEHGELDEKKEKMGKKQSVKHWLLDQGDPNDTVTASGENENNERIVYMERRIRELEKRGDSQQWQAERKQIREETEMIVEETAANIKREVQNEIKKGIQEIMTAVDKLKSDQIIEFKSLTDRIEEMKNKNKKEMEELKEREEKKGKDVKKDDQRKKGRPKRLIGQIDSLEQQQLCEWRMKQALEAIPKFDGSSSMYNIWKERLLEVMDEFEILEKKSYVKFQMMKDRLEEKVADEIKDLAGQEIKAFESAMDRLDRKYKRRSARERTMVKVKEISKMDDTNKEKWKTLRLFLDSIKIANSELELEIAIELIIVFIFDKHLSEKWNVWATREEGNDMFAIMKKFLENTYEKAAEKELESNQKEKEVERVVKCYMCDDKHGLKCKKLAEMSREERLERINELSLCFNCLKPSHTAEECRRPPCKCGERKHFRIHQCKRQYLMTIRISGSSTLSYINYKKQRILTMPDLGSDISIISSQLAKKMKLKKLGTIRLKVITIDREFEQKAGVFEITIREKKVKVFGFDRLPKVSQEGVKNQIPRIDNEQLELILGNDCYHLIKHRKINDIDQGIIIETPIGKIFYPNDTKNEVKVNMLLKESSRKEQKISIEEERMVKRLEKDMKIKEDHIEAPLMLRKEVKEILCSYSQAKKRLIAQLKRMRKDEKLEKIYDEAIYAYLDEGYAIEKPKNIKPLNFIPHHIVKNRNKKPRLVFACNTKGKEGESLNDVLVKGIINLNEIPTLLYKWREKRYFGLADIKAMYHQILLLEEQFGLCSFLYWKKGVKKNEENISTFVMTRHVFGAKDSPCIAIKALEKMLEKLNLQKEEVNKIKRSFYMDDLLITSDNEGEVEKLMVETKEGLSPQFNLTKIYSNLEKINQKYQKESVECNRVLGIKYQPEEDKIIFSTEKFRIKPKSKKPTYQDMASALMKMYDPQGLIEPIRAIFKSMYSKEIKKKKKWMDKVEDDIIKEWEEMVKKYENQLTLPRYVGQVQEYAMFVDASKQRFGAALYGLVKDQYLILASKSRVIPQKEKISEESIPNNELNAAVLGAELAKEYCFEESKKPIKFFSDNKAVLQYIKNHSIKVDDYKRRRIEKIIELTHPEQWYYVRSEDNPADMLTKAPSPQSLQHWFTRDKQQVSIVNMILPWEENEKDEPEESIIGKIRDQQKVINLEKVKRKLNIVEEDGIWKVVLRKIKGKNNKRILLSNKMKVAEEIANKIHKRAHIGRDNIRVQLRFKFYTLGETELAKRVYENCETCIRLVKMNRLEYKGNDPHPDQVMQGIYKNIGIDHTGALKTKQGNKIYILLIICLYSRNITLQVVESLEAKEVELALIQLETNNEGIRSIHSDNYKSFIKLEKKHKNWKFTAPYAPYQGGSWERAIQTAKRVLAPYLGKEYSLAEWKTLCVITENAINSRPINQLINDPEQEVITPFLLAKNYKMSKDSQVISPKWRKRLKKMIQNWHCQMLEIIMRQRREDRSGVKPKKGQLVILKDSTKKRNVWKKYKIRDLIRSHDGNIKNVNLEGIKDKYQYGKRSVKDIVIIDD